MFSLGKDDAPVATIIRFSGEIVDSTEDSILSLGSSSVGIDYNTYRDVIKEAFAFPNVKAVILVVNSPGGAPTQANLIARHIRNMATKTGIAVYCIVEDLAASAGYDLACSADEIYVNECSSVGSIGVIFMSIGLTKAMKMLGFEGRVLTSSEHKAGLHPFLEDNQVERKIVNAHVQKMHKNFAAWIKKRRPNLSKDKDVFSGRVFIGQEAVKKGLADGVKSLSELVEMKFEKADDVKLIEVKRKLPMPSLLDILAGFIR